MSSRETYRLLNRCTTCGHTWYPRGSDLSVRCPNCRSETVDFAPSQVEQFAGSLVSFLGSVADAITDLFRLVVLPAIKWAGELTAPALHAVSSWLAAAAQYILSNLLGALKWFASVKEDILADDQSKVNPYLLVTKLLLITIISIGTIVALIECFSRLARHP